MFLILEIRNVDVQNHKWLKIIDIEYLNVDVSKYILKMRYFLMFQNRNYYKQS